MQSIGKGFCAPAAMRRHFGLCGFERNSKQHHWDDSFGRFLALGRTARQILMLDAAWTRQFKWYDFGGCIRMTTNVLHASPVAQRQSIRLLTVN